MTAAADELRFLAHALAIEAEATERYRDLAEQMRAHHNAEVALLFDSLAAMEEAHGVELCRRIAARGEPLPQLAPWEYEWVDVESPEAVPFESAHYLMTPHHALRLALANEQRAEAFFAAAAAAATDATVRRLATEMAAEEARHVAHVERELAAHPAPAGDWDLDLDPPTEGE